MFGDMVVGVKQSCSLCVCVVILSRVSLLYYSMIIESTTWCVKVEETKMMEEEREAGTAQSL